MEKHISTIITANVNNAFEQKRAASKKFYTPDYARFKLQCKKADGETSIPYHSYDTHKGPGGMTITDEQAGLFKLTKLGEKKIWLEGFAIATVWANVSPDTRTYIGGKLNKAYNVIVWMMIHGKDQQYDCNLKFADGVMDIEHMKQMLQKGKVA